MPCPREGEALHGQQLLFRAVTVITGTVVGLAFLFGFGNVWTLALRLGVSGWVAPLVAPAVDLSVVALLLAIRYLALCGAREAAVRPARRLLFLTSVLTLALNVAEPLLAGAYGRAAFDAVGPLLLIGRAEVGAGLLQAISGIRADTAEAPTAPGGRTGRIGGRLRRGQPDESAILVDDDDELIERARAEDVLHWRTHHRPISAETLRKRLHIGAVAIPIPGRHPPHCGQAPPLRGEPSRRVGVTAEEVTDDQGKPSQAVWVKVP